MKHYITEYEKYLLDHIHKLEYHIQIRNEYLIKANGYAPDNLPEMEFNLEQRCLFSVTFLSEKEFLDKYKIRKYKYYKGQEGGFSVSLKNGVFETQLSLSELKILRSFAGKQEFGGFIENKEYILVKNIREQPFPRGFFSDIKPLNLPELIF